MVKNFSKVSLLAGASILVSGLTYANLNNTPLQTTSNDATMYSAHGSMDKRSALLLKSLLQNPNVKVSAVVGNSSTQKKTNANNEITYTIKGKTSRRTAMLLKQLLKNSKHLSIQAEITKNNRLNNSNMMIPTYTTHFPEYTPFYYKGVPPVYARGNTLWYPVKINDRKIINEISSTNSKQYKTLASN